MKRLLFILGCFVIYWAYGTIVVIVTKDGTQCNFVWNVMLAFIPFLAAEILKMYVGGGRKSRLLISLMVFFWLVFFPNAPYMASDLIHLTERSMLNPDDMNTVLFWFKLLYYAMGILFGTIVGLESLRTMHRIAIKRFGRLISAAFITGVGLLGGFAVYVGRILRFNTWDILKPGKILASFATGIDMFTVWLSMLFALYILGAYVLYYFISSGQVKELLSNIENSSLR